MQGPCERVALLNGRELHNHEEHAREQLVLQKEVRKSCDGGRKRHVQESASELPHLVECWRQQEPPVHKCSAAQ